MKKYSPSFLKKNISAALSSVEVREDVADNVASGLLWTSLRGIDSHGIRLLPHYISSVSKGVINPNPKVKFSQLSSSLGYLDADHTFGHHAGVLAMEHCVEMARESGVAIVSVGNSTHCGAMSFFGYESSKEGIATLSMTHATPRILSPNTKTAFLGNNPICFIAPVKDNPPFCFDSATTTTTFNAIKLKGLIGGTLSPGEAADSNGCETLNPLLAEFLLPIGGYKGYGLSMVVDILCGALSGMNMGDKVSKMYGDDAPKRRMLGQFYLAIDIDKVFSSDKFGADMERFVGNIRSQDKIDKKSKEPLVPGDIEEEEFLIRDQAGIPIDGDVYRELSKLQGWSEYD